MSDMSEILSVESHLPWLLGQAHTQICKDKLQDVPTRPAGRSNPIPKNNQASNRQDTFVTDAIQLRRLGSCALAAAKNVSAPFSTDAAADNTASSACLTFEDLAEGRFNRLDLYPAACLTRTLRSRPGSRTPPEPGLGADAVAGKEGRGVDSSASASDGSESLLGRRQFVRRSSQVR